MAGNTAQQQARPPAAWTGPGTRGWQALATFYRPGRNYGMSTGIRGSVVLESLGLGGDGDEWEAIGRVERAFGVQLDSRDAPDWHTVGDVHASLLKILPDKEWNTDETWQRFTNAIAAESGVDPRQVAPATLLLALSVWDVIGRWLRRVMGR